MVEDAASERIGKDLSRYVARVGGMKRMLPLFAAVAGKLATDAHEKYDRFVAEQGAEKEVDSSGAVTRYEVPLAQIGGHRRLIRALDDSDVFSDQLPKMAVIALVSIYDSFLGSLVRAFYLAKPEALNGSKRELTYAQLASFQSIEEAREHIVEKEVEGLLRDSHVEQFDWLEERIGAPLRKNLVVWPEFVELTERRNIFVHADAVVGAQYLSVCRQHGVTLEADVKPGTPLHVPQRYFLRCCDVMMEIGVKLGQVLWRKILPEQLEDADRQLNEVCYELLTWGEYAQASAFGEFACAKPPVGLPRHSSAEAKLMFQVNLAQSYKWQGRQPDCEKVLADVDWSALRGKFRLAAAVLRDDFDAAAGLVRKIGRGDEVPASAYSDWPLFREFRKSQLFRDAYQEVFGEPFRVMAPRHVDASATERTEGPTGQPAAPVPSLPASSS